jgi:hypothetical protein
MRRFAVAIELLVVAACAHANCVCRCVEGEVRQLCSSPMDLQTLCPPMLCPAAQPQPLAPLQPLQPIPPLGTTSCRRVQVLNPLTQRYELRTVCQ